MKITVGPEPYFTVTVERGPGETLEFSPRDAYAIWQSLNGQHMLLFDLATNYYECSECGGMHSKGMNPHTEPKEDEESEE
jgi:hypothetical protein